MCLRFFLPCPFLPRMIVTHSRSACNRNPGKEKTTAERRKIKEEKNCEQQQEDKRDRPLPLFVRHCFFLPNEKKEDREEGRVVVIKRPRHTHSHSDAISLTLRPVLFQRCVHATAFWRPFARTKKIWPDGTIRTQRIEHEHHHHCR